MSMLSYDINYPQLGCQWRNLATFYSISYISVCPALTTQF